MTGGGSHPCPVAEAGLTKAQYYALCVIEELTEAAGYAPSIREIAHEMDMVVSGAHTLVERLRERGWIAVPSAQARGIWVLRRPVMPDFAALEAAGWALTDAGLTGARRGRGAPAGAQAVSARPLGADFGWVYETLCAALCTPPLPGSAAVKLTPRQTVICHDLDARLDTHGSGAAISRAELAVIREVRRKIERAWW